MERYRGKNFPAIVSIQRFTFECKRIVGEDDHGAAMVANPPNAITSPPSPQSQIQNTALEQQEWEIAEIVGKKRAGKGYEYRVHWKDTWLRKNELGNAQRLLKE